MTSELVAQNQPGAALTSEDTAANIVATLATWRPHPTKVRLLLERARDRLASEATIAGRVGIGRKTLSHYRHDPRDSVFRTLYPLVAHDERYAVLVLAALTMRGAHATLYDAVNGGRVSKAQISATQIVIDSADRRYKQRNQDPLPTI